MHVRRVILLFAIVLGLSALAASIAPRQDDTGDDGAEAPRSRERPTARPRPADERELAVVLDARATTPQTRTVRRGRHVILSVAVPEAGQVTLAGLGEVREAERRTPALFDLLPSETGRFDAVFTPSDGGPARRAGTLVVTR